MINFEYTRVSSVKSAVEALTKNPGSTLIAGGTNLIDLMKKGVTSPQRLIDINNLPLNQVQATATGLQIGALTINSELAANPAVGENYPLLKMALSAGASPQLRNMATVGGNMMQRTRCPYFYDTATPCNKREPGSGCSALQGYNRMHAIFGSSDKCIAVHPSDMCVALVALDAVVQVAGPKGERKIPFNDFHRLPGNEPQKDNNLLKGEMITGVLIPRNNFKKNVHYLKIRDRASYAFALVSVATALELSGGVLKNIRLAMGGVAHKPWRLFDVEKFLVNKAPTKENFEKAAGLAVKNAKAFNYNSFKIKMTVAAITEALNKAMV